MKTQLKNILTVGALVCSLATLTVPTVAATELPQFLGSYCTGSSARYVGMRNFYAELSISDAGLATSSGTIQARSGYTCDATLELQRKQGSSWITINEWDDSGTGMVIKANWLVTSGYDYRTKLSADVYDDSDRFVETLTVYSPVVEY